MFFTYVINAIFSVAMFINAALFIPQIMRLLKTKNAEGLSTLTFLGFNLIQLSGVCYGLLHNDKILTIGFSMSLVSCGTVTLLILYYRKKP